MRHRFALALLITTTSACDGGDKPAPAAQDQAASSADAAAEVPLTGSPTDLATEAARVANAIEQMPGSADSILKAAGQTPESFQQLMYRIAADSAMSAAYSAVRQK
jgi:hypothetical protein